MRFDPGPSDNINLPAGGNSNPSPTSCLCSRMFSLLSSRAAVSFLRKAGGVSPFQKQLFSSATTSTLIINAVGLDRLGIVADVTGIVIAHGGNVGDSQAAKLGQHFSLMMHVTLPSAQLDDLQTSLKSMSDMNASVFVDTSSEGRNSVVTPQIGYQGMFSLEGADNPGIVHVMTTALAKHGLNIDKLETDQEIAPHGGTMLFRMKGKAVAYQPLAASFDASQIQQDLQELGASLNCDVELEELDDEGTSGSFYAG